MRLFLILLLTAVTACAAPNRDVRPERISLDASFVSVYMNNGFRCRGYKTDQTANETGWAGTLQDCPTPYTYDVVLAEKSNILARATFELFKALGSENVLTPLAEVTVTRPDGRIFEFETKEKWSKGARYDHQ